MILDNGFPAPGDKYKLFNPGVARFFHRILDQRLVHDRKHFLRHGLCRRQKSCSEAADGEYGFANFFRHIYLTCCLLV